MAHRRVTAPPHIRAGTLLAALLVALLGFAPSRADAQSERELLQQARDRMAQGEEHFLAGRFEDAASSFLSAYEARPFSVFLYNAGWAYERAERYELAARYYDRFVQEDPDAVDVGDVQDRADRIRQVLAESTPRAEQTAVAVATPDAAGDGSLVASAEGTEATEAGAGMTESTEGTEPTEPAGDGESAGETGDGTQVASAEGTEAASDVPGSDVPASDVPASDVPASDVSAATIEASDTPERRAALAAAVEASLVNSASPEFKSLLSVETVPADAIVTVRRNGEVVGRGPSPFGETLDAGEYEISVEHPDYTTISREMRIRPGKVYVAILEMSQGEFLGYLRVVSEPPGAAVYIDDREEGSVGNTPYYNPVGVGEHTVYIERPGFAPEQRAVNIEIGEEVTLRVPITRLSYGRLRITGNRGARVEVDGVDVGEVPLDEQVEAGTHDVRISLDGMKDWHEEVEIMRGQLTPIEATLRPAPSRSTAWTLATLGLVSVGGGVALAVIADGIHSDLEADAAAGTLESEDPRLSEGFWFSIGADGAFGLGLVLGLVSIYYFVRDPLPDSEADIFEPRDWTFVPTFDPVRQTASANFQLSF